MTNVNISQKQDLLLKQVARQRGVNESAVIRQALEREFGLATLDSSAAFEKIEAYMADRKTDILDRLNLTAGIELRSMKNVSLP
ncbi:MAG: hypothetical protein WCK35_14020 [Chloroflexota bacterium]